MTGDTAVLEHHLRPLRPRLDADGVIELVINRPGEFAVGAWRRFDLHDAPELTAAWLQRPGDRGRGRDRPGCQPRAADLLYRPAHRRALPDRPAPRRRTPVADPAQGRRLHRLTLDDLEAGGLFAALADVGLTRARMRSWRYATPMSAGRGGAAQGGPRAPQRSDLRRYRARARPPSRRWCG